MLPHPYNTTFPPSQARHKKALHSAKTPHIQTCTSIMRHSFKGWRVFPPGPAARAAAATAGDPERRIQTYVYIIYAWISPLRCFSTLRL